MPNYIVDVINIHFCKITVCFPQMNISSSQNLSKLWGPDAAGVAAAAANSSITKAQFESPALFVGLLSVSLITIFGNALVILAVLRERTLHSATNYFITSLAVSDMLVGAVVMPFSAFYEAMDKKVRHITCS